jgi:hypothetical protein
MCVHACNPRIVPNRFIIIVSFLVVAELIFGAGKEGRPKDQGMEDQDMERQDEAVYDKYNG